MKIKMFYQSLVSDWNHGNAHFLRGIVKELIKMGEEVEVYEPDDGWCLHQLIKDKHGSALAGFHDYYPDLFSNFYSLKNFQPDEVLKDADLVIVHEFNKPQLIKVIGDYRAQHDHFKLLFHDTHHRSVSKPEEMAAFDLANYDGVLAFGEIIRKIYLQKGWAENVWAWHEAADTELFRPIDTLKKGDVVWIGNWGDDERSREIVEFIVEPIRELELEATIYGVRYPKKALDILEKAGIKYGGYLPNYKVPEVFAQYRATIHVPRKYYTQKLPGIPTIRPFEAMACGIPLISAPWQDAEGLFRPGKDFVYAHSKEEMKNCLKKVLSSSDFAARLSAHGVETIRARHTCRHRAKELLNICQWLHTQAANAFVVKNIF